MNATLNLTAKELVEILREHLLCKLPPIPTVTVQITFDRNLSVNSPKDFKINFAVISANIVNVELTCTKESL